MSAHRAVCEALTSGKDSVGRTGVVLGPNVGVGVSGRGVATGDGVVVGLVVGVGVPAGAGVVAGIVGAGSVGGVQPAVSNQPKHNKLASKHREPMLTSLGGVYGTMRQIPLQLSNLEKLRQSTLSCL